MAPYLLLALSLVAGEGSDLPDTAQTVGRLCVVVPRAEDAAGPIVGEFVSKASGRVTVRPLGSGADQTFKLSGLQGVFSDEPPALKRYLEEYRMLARARWIYRQGDVVPQLGFEVEKGEESVTLRVLDGQRGWRNVAVAPKSFRVESSLRTEDFEAVLGPIPLPEDVTVSDQDEAATVPTCARCEGRGTIPCPKCTTGKVLVKCSACKGSGTIPCQRCSGSGSIPCSACKGSGTERRRTLSGEVFDRPCPTCRGGGRLRCYRCSGKGTQRCSACRGSGTVEATCPTCQGKRRVPCPDCAESKDPPGEATATGDDPAPAAWDYRGADVLAIKRVVGELKDLLEEHRTAVKAAQAVHAATTTLHKTHMRGKDSRDFRMWLKKMRPEVNAKITKLYRRSYQLERRLDTLCTAASRKETLLDRQLRLLRGRDSTRTDIGAATRRLNALHGDLGQFGNGAKELIAADRALEVVLDAEGAAFNRDQAKGERRARLREEMDEYLEDALQLSGARLTLKGDTLRVAATFRGSLAREPDSELIHRVGDVIFESFGEVDTIELRTRGNALGPLTRDVWQATYDVRQERAALKAEEKQARGKKVEVDRKAPHEDGGVGFTVVLLLGGVVGSFLLLSRVLRARSD